MRHKRLQLSAVLLLGLGLTGLQAQETISASGGNTSGSGRTVAYRVGQVVYTTNTGTNRYTGTTGDGLYAGAMNTAMIVATQMSDNETGSFAAKVCADYSVTVDGVTYEDWYLP